MSRVSVRNGSALLLVTLVTVVITGLCQPFVQTSSLLLDLALVRFRHIEQHLTTRALLDYGITIVKDNWQKIIEQSEPIFIRFDDWPLAKNRVIAATILIQSDGQRAMLKTSTKLPSQAMATVANMIITKSDDHASEPRFHGADLVWSKEK